MAWEDRTPFDAIKAQFGISHDDVVNLMRKNLKKSSFKDFDSNYKSLQAIKLKN